MSEIFNNFKLDIEISRAYESDDGRWLFEGIASSTAVDSHDTIFSVSCQEGFVFDIEDGMRAGEPIELEAEHLGDDLPMNVVGSVVAAEVDDAGKLRVRCELDKDNPQAQFYWNKMTKINPRTGKVKRFGLSIHGHAVDAGWQFVKDLNKSLQVFHRVKLKRVGIVRKPSNPESWIGKMLRSVDWESLKSNEILRSENEPGGLFVSVVSKGDDVQQKSENELKLEILEKIERGEDVFTEDVAKNLQDWLLSLAANIGSYPKAAQQEALKEEIDSKLVEELMEEALEEKMESDQMMKSDTSSMSESNEDLSDEVEYITDEDLYRLCGKKMVRFDIGGEWVEMSADSIMEICREWAKLSKTKNMQRSEEQNVEDKVLEQVDEVSTEVEVQRSEEASGELPESQPEVADAVAEPVVADAAEVVQVAEQATEEVQEVVADSVERSEENKEQYDAGLIEVLRKSIVDSMLLEMKPMIEALQNEVKTLRSEKDDLVKQSEELVTRLAVVENQPAGVPGIIAAGIESDAKRSESKTKEEKRAEAIKRAKEQNNKVEALRLLTDPNYVGE